MSGLPPYSGPYVSCPKCKTAMDTTWHPGGMGDEGLPCMQGGAFIGEHLCRTCPRCKYGWVEATADASEEQVS